MLLELLCSHGDWVGDMLAPRLPCFSPRNKKQAILVVVAFDECSGCPWFGGNDLKMMTITLGITSRPLFRFNTYRKITQSGVWEVDYEGKEENRHVSNDEVMATA